MSSDVLSRIESAMTAADLFGSDPDADFKRLAKLCHPDKHGANKARAEKAMQRLSELRQSLKNATEVRIGNWKIESPLAKGSISDLYLVSGKATGILRIAREELDNDLLANEARNLKLLNGAKEPESEPFKRFMPSILDTFEASGRRANVLSNPDGCHSLTYIKTALGNLDFRHVVWMGNRLFSALGYAHSKGIIHGATLPSHLLYRLADHGLILWDWASSVKFPDDDGHIPLVSGRWKEYYPAEVRKKGCFCSTDLYMAAKSLQYAAGGQHHIPRRFQPIFEHLLAGSPASRPSSAFEVQDRWKRLAEEEYGKPQFLPLTIPVS